MLRSLVGSEMCIRDRNFGILMAGISIMVLLLCLLVLTTMSLSAVKWVGRKRRKVATGNIILEDNVVDIVEPTDLEVKSSEIELIDENIDENSNLRRQRRNSRKMSNQSDEVVMAIPPQPIALPPPVDSLEMPQINRTILCPDCSARFEVASGLKMIKCPICENRISL
mgnify:CR=1 FL=1